MTPREAFWKFADYILNPTDTGHGTIEAIAVFAAEQLSTEERRLSVEYLREKSKEGAENLMRLWWSSNARIGPDTKSAQKFTEIMIDALLNRKIASKAHLQAPKD